ncbi:MAG TPA: hypothetical protein VJ999_00780 [Candidatus Sulfotelmatobacter sp.]|nr:hypothetical protein [Candidatus Sulfotelmatobacter sp.]
MPRFFLAVSLLLSTVLVVAQNASASDPLAVSLAQKSFAALTGGLPIADVTLTGAVTWTAGSDTETGTATLEALGMDESRMDLVLSGGSRSEIRDVSTGTPLGQWTASNNSSDFFALQNCFTDPVWFFPALGSLSGGQTIVLVYIGQETRNGATVQHIRSYSTQSPGLPPPLPSVQQLSTMDFYLDAATLLPSAIVFNSHPDSDPFTNIRVEIDFSNYQAIGGVMVPLHIQRYWQGTLAVDLAITGATFNTGLSLSNFTISQ